MIPKRHKRHLHWKLQLNKFYLPHQCSLSNHTNILEKAGSRNLIMRSKNYSQINVNRRTQKLKELKYFICNTNSWEKKIKMSSSLEMKMEKMGGKKSQNDLPENLAITKNRPFYIFEVN